MKSPARVPHLTPHAAAAVPGAQLSPEDASKLLLMLINTLERPSSSFHLHSKPSLPFSAQPGSWYLCEVVPGCPITLYSSSFLSNCPTLPSPRGPNPKPGYFLTGGGGRESNFCREGGSFSRLGLGIPEVKEEAASSLGCQALPPLPLCLARAVLPYALPTSTFCLNTLLWTLLLQEDLLTLSTACSAFAPLLVWPIRQPQTWIMFSDLPMVKSQFS